MVHTLQTIFKLHSSDHVVLKKIKASWNPVLFQPRKTILFRDHQGGNVASSETPRIEIFAGKMKGSNQRQEPNQRHPGGLESRISGYSCHVMGGIYSSGILDAASSTTLVVVELGKCCGNKYLVNFKSKENSEMSRGADP